MRIDTGSIFGSVGGAVLLVCGLYSVLWGKNKEAKEESVGNDEETPDDQTKEGNILECITHH